MTLSIKEIQNLRHVEAHDLATFLIEVEKAIRDGYTISLEHNETYPYGTLGHYIVKMPKSAEPIRESQEVSKLIFKLDPAEVEKALDNVLQEAKRVQEEEYRQVNAEADTDEQPKARPGRPAKAK